MCPVLTFQRTSHIDFSDLNVEVDNDMSCDQKYRYMSCKGVITDVVDDDLVPLEICPSCLSRLGTFLSRILRLYVATPRPSHELKSIVITIIYFSAPMWLDIKFQPYV